MFVSFISLQNAKNYHWNIPADIVWFCCKLIIVNGKYAAHVRVKCWMLNVLKHMQSHSRTTQRLAKEACSMLTKRMEHQYKFMSLVFYDTKAQKRWIFLLCVVEHCSFRYVFGRLRHSQKRTQMWSVEIVSKLENGVENSLFFRCIYTFSKQIQLLWEIFKFIFFSPEALRFRIIFMTWNFLFAHFAYTLSVYSE